MKCTIIAICAIVLDPSFLKRYCKDSCCQQINVILDNIQVAMDVGMKSGLNIPKDSFVLLVCFLDYFLRCLGIK